MRRVREYIDVQGTAFAAKPLFGYLRDPNVAPERRLRFVPFLSHFVMSFSDLYGFFLVEHPARDRHQELVNIHLSEDVHHWKWFLADLRTLDLDPTVRFSDALRFIWGDSTAKTRALTYQVCKMSSGMSSLEKLVLVHCIEATGGVALGAVASAGRELEAASGRKLVYFGSHHVDTEREHTLEQPDVQRLLDDVHLSEAESARLFLIVDEAFGHFGNFVDEVYGLALRGLGVPAFPEGTPPPPSMSNSST